VHDYIQLLEKLGKKKNFVSNMCAIYGTRLHVVCFGNMHAFLLVLQISLTTESMRKQHYLLEHKLKTSISQRI